MNISFLDRSNYLKGLMIIAKKDKQLAESEKNIIRKVGEKLGFAEDFYEDTLKSLLANKYILDDPIIFSDGLVAKSFVKDGLTLAFSDNKVSDIEIDWLKLTSAANGIDDDWFNNRLHSLENSKVSLASEEFALYSII